MGSVFLYRMPAGIPGAVMRLEHLLTEPGLLLASAPPTGYGQALVVDTPTGKYRTPQAGDTADSIAGLLVRSYPNGTTTTAYDGIGVSGIVTNRVNDIMRRGYMTVLLGGSVAVGKGLPLFIRIANAAPGQPVGGIEAQADGTNTVALPARSYFMGPADAQNNVEIAWNL